MKEQNYKDEVTKILDDVPSVRKALLENYDNLMNVADYCYNNYLQSEEDRVNALEETKNFTTQSLASVAYQISILASNVLSLLNAQSNQLLHMESSINLVGQMIEMHKEKVSRREIGVFTAVRRVPRSHKILPPAQDTGNSQLRPLYSRQPINYQHLDGLGHSMKISGKQPDKSGPVRKHGSSIRSNKPPEPVQCPVAPPPVSSSSFGKPVALPTVPTNWQPPPDCDIITTLLDEATPPPPPTLMETSSQDECASDLAPPPPPPSEAVQNHSTTALAPLPAPPLAPPPAPALAPPPPPALTPPPASALTPPMTPPPPPALTPPLAPPPPPALAIPPPPPLETVVEENSFPAPPPPPLSDDDGFPSLPSDGPELLVPPPLCQDADALEIPAPPPPLLLDDESGFDDFMMPLPPPAFDNTDTPDQYLEQVVALYSYEASKPGDLSFIKGDVIYMTHRHDDGWCEGMLHGNQGFFPINYVQSHI
ncbi:ABI family, member 3a isoform X2 [Thalassophryne amazonica]|uniref:ABI family, member 3a isoform X2 n=1 Tax=Thalassophryne amazonica TaxID=390379 RepID=UPI0014711E31|nr:ABI family, member 3a isoform X2 [Thalassophryne amazonica]